MSNVRAALDELMAATGTLGALQATIHRDAPPEVRRLCVAHVSRAIIELGDAFAMLVARVDAAPGVTSPPLCATCRGVGSIRLGKGEWELCRGCGGERVQRAAP